jgi:hypothetical protein
MRRPQETSQWFKQTAAEIASELALAQKAIGAKAGNEFLSTTTDLKMLAGLARYYAFRLPAAVDYNIYKESGDQKALERAIEGERRAVAAYRVIVEAAGDVYSDKLPFGARSVGFRQHWKEEYALLEQDFNSLEAESHAKVGDGPERTFTARELNLNPPVVTLPAPGIAEPGKDFKITAKAGTPQAVKWIRLRYRHVSQYEDYQTAEMELDSKTGLYSAAIPAAFIDPKWDLMYFVEAVGKNGSGRMYPDLERETPYVIVGVKR